MSVCVCACGCVCVYARSLESFSDSTNGSTILAALLKAAPTIQQDFNSSKLRHQLNSIVSKISAHLLSLCCLGCTFVGKSIRRIQKARCGVCVCVQRRLAWRLFSQRLNSIDKLFIIIFDLCENTFTCIYKTAFFPVISCRLHSI